MKIRYSFKCKKFNNKFKKQNEVCNTTFDIRTFMKIKINDLINGSVQFPQFGTNISLHNEK